MFLFFFHLDGLLTHPIKGIYLQPKYQGSAFQLVTSFNLVLDRHPVDNINFNLISLNVWGIRDFAKRKAIFSWIKKQNADIAFLQETYSTPDLVENGVSSCHAGKMFYSHGTNHSRGVLIYNYHLLLLSENSTD